MVQLEETTDPDMAQRRDEHFIPLSKREIASRIVAEASWLEPERLAFRDLCRLLLSAIRFESQESFDELQAAYSVFEPDTTETDWSVNDNECANRCVEKIESLLRKANYRRLTDKELDHAYGAASEWGVRLNVNLKAFSQLAVFVRGTRTDVRTLRRWWRWFWPQDVDVELYERLFVVYRLKDDANTDIDDSNLIHLRLFKDIPVKDVDMLLPCIRVRMSLFDQGRVFLPTFSGMVFSAVKTVKAFFVFTLAAGLFAFFALLALIVGTIGYAARSILGYLQVRKNYHHHVTQSLYYQNLGRNQNVLSQVLHEAEEQDFREVMLAWYVAQTRTTHWSELELDSAVEKFLLDRLGVALDFEIQDALTKAGRYQLITRCGADEYRAVSLDQALIRLDRKWDNYFRYHR